MFVKVWSSTERVVCVFPRLKMLWRSSCWLVGFELDWPVLNARFASMFKLPVLRPDRIILLTSLATCLPNRVTVAGIGCNTRHYPSTYNEYPRVSSTTKHCAPEKGGLSQRDMTFYDLNLPYGKNDTNLARTLAFEHELGYNVVALNHTISGKLPTDNACIIPNPLPFKDLPPKLEILRRLTIVLSEPLQNARLNALAKEYDLLALRPTDERTLQLACSSLDCDIISMDFTLRLPFFFKFKMLSEALKSGKRFEICYAGGVLGDGQARRNLISNSTQIIRATRGGRGLVMSSSATAAVGLRGPWDVVNLAAVWGLGQERGYEAISKEARAVVVTAALKRTSYRGVISVVQGGEKPLPAPVENGGAKNGPVKGNQSAGGQKRKAEVLGNEDSGKGAQGEQPLSKTQMKKRAKLAKIEAEKSKAGGLAATRNYAAVEGERTINGSVNAT